MEDLIRARAAALQKTLEGGPAKLEAFVEFQTSIAGLSGVRSREEVEKVVDAAAARKREVEEANAALDAAAAAAAASLKEKKAKSVSPSHAGRPPS